MPMDFSLELVVFPKQKWNACLALLLSSSKTLVWGSSSAGRALG